MLLESTLIPGLSAMMNKRYLKIHCIASTLPLLDVDQYLSRSRNWLPTVLPSHCGRPAPRSDQRERIENVAPFREGRDDCDANVTVRRTPAFLCTPSRSS